MTTVVVPGGTFERLERMWREKKKKLKKKKKKKKPQRQPAGEFRVFGNNNKRPMALGERSGGGRGRGVERTMLERTDAGIWQRSRLFEGTTGGRGGGHVQDDDPFEKNN